MGEALGRPDHVGAGGVERQRGLAGAEDDVAAHAGREVEDDVGAGVAHALDDLAVERQRARALAGLGVADMDVGDGGAGAGGLDRGLGDLLRRDGHVGAAPRRVARARDRAGDEDVGVHARELRVPMRAGSRGPARPARRPRDVHRRVATRRTIRAPCAWPAPKAAIARRAAPRREPREWKRSSRDGRVDVTENLWIPLADGTRLAARMWRPRAADAGPGGPGIHPLPQARRHARPRRADARLLRGAGYAALRVDMRGSGDSDGLLDDEYLRAGAGRRPRGHRLDRRPALVLGRGRHDGQELGRLQRAAGGGAAPAGAEGHRHGLLHRRPLRRRHPLQGRLPAQRQSVVGRHHAGLPGPAARPRDPRRLARALAGAARRHAVLAGPVARPPEPRRLLAPRLGLRGLGRDRSAPSSRSAAGATPIRMRCRACSRTSRCRASASSAPGPTSTRRTAAPARRSISWANARAGGITG